MLYISMALSAILLVGVNRIVARSRYPIFLGILCCLAFVAGPAYAFPAYFMKISLSAVHWQALFLCVLLIFLRAPVRKWFFPPLSCITTLIAYGILLAPAVEKQQEYAQLRDKYPFESLDQRLPLPPTPSRSSDPERLNQLERRIENRFHFREVQLRTIHSSSVVGFINSAGFGEGRMDRFYRPDARTLKNEWRESGPVSQPDYLGPFISPTESLSANNPNWSKFVLGRMHDDGVLDFVNPDGFGFIKDRTHVAGFQSHEMTRAPKSSDSWVVAHIELVGLLQHSDPVVYISANLPRMNELRGAPVRPLNEFEADALVQLRGGEDVIAVGTDDRARMMGAIRSTKQCLECHGGERGNLLGAFSYSLRREKQ